MITFRRLCHLVRNVILALFALVLIAVVCVHVQKHVLRHRAEGLLADVQTLELRRSTLADVRRIVGRWNGAVRYEGPCNEQRCNIEIVQNDFAYRHLNIFGGRERLQAAYMAIGGRPAAVRATLAVRNGIVWGKSFEIDVEVPSYTDGQRQHNQYTLIGQAKTLSRFPVPAVDLRSNYMIGGPSKCTYCQMIYFRFTPFADPTDIRRLMQFDFSCLTRWNPCRTQAEIMPVAWAEHTRANSTARMGTNDTRCTTNALVPGGRDADSAAIVELIRTQAQGYHQSGTVRLIERLKGDDPWPLGHLRELTFDPHYLVHSDNTGTAEAKSGNRYILLYQYWPPGPAVEVNECGMVPLTAGNLSAVRSGIEQDFEAVDSLKPRF